MIKKLSIPILLLISMLRSINCYAQTSPPIEQGAPPTEKELASPPSNSKYKGLQIDRATLLKSLTSHDSTLNFTKDKELNKMPVLTAHGLANSNVLVTGTEYNLHEVSYEAFIVTGNIESIHSAFDKVANVIGTVIPRKVLIQWMLRNYSSVNLFAGAPVKQSYSIEANLITFTYDPSAKSIKIDITSGYN